jgi:signal transduction histidine kinase
VSRRYRSSRIGMGRLAQWWPVLLSLLVVLVPTICVLWFMAEAVENRRQVVRRALADADFTIAQERLDRSWDSQAAKLQESWPQDESPLAAFQRCVLEKLADSVVIYDANGQPVYPTSARSPTAGKAEGEIDWAGIEKLEHQQRDLTGAAAAYAKIAADHGGPEHSDSFDINLAARALTAQARCLAKANQREAAIAILTDTLNRPQYAKALDSDGRLIIAAAELRALELIEDRADPKFHPVAKRLSKRLNGYDEPLLASSQRRFLMRRVLELVGEGVEFPTLEAEDLAAEFREANPRPSKDSVVRLTQSPGLWQLASPDGRVYGIFRTENVLSRSRKMISERELKSGAEVKPVPPGEASSADAAFHSTEAGRYLPGWRLTRSFAGGEDLEPVSDTQIVAYFWTGVLVIGAMSIFALIIARAFRRQMKLTRLRNDLVATVSHELKTPLSSIRLLVDTLLDEQELDEQRVREYLELMAKENKRLSRLIDNFLAFSRMERNKHAFEFAEVRVADIIEAAVDVVRERFDAPGCQLEVEVAPDLPPIDADADAIVTVLLNLLDNAYKYSPDEKQVVLRAYAQDGNVCLEVKDNGIGLSRAAAKKVFRRFYQVDYRVSRDTGGVGLGLSIVQFIVTAHGGTVGVTSRPEYGSKFTVAIPAMESSHHNSTQR